MPRAAASIVRGREAHLDEDNLRPEYWVLHAHEAYEKHWPTDPDWFPNNVLARRDKIREWCDYWDGEEDSPLREDIRAELRGSGIA